MFLGARGWYKYTTDGYDNFKIEMQHYLAEIAGLEADESLPTLPKRITPRYIWLQETTPVGRPPKRKKVIVQAEYFQKFRPGTNVMVGDMEMQIKSMVGEKRRAGYKDGHGGRP